MAKLFRINYINLNIAHNKSTLSHSETLGIMYEIIENVKGLKEIETKVQGCLKQFSESVLLTMMQFF